MNDICIMNKFCRLVARVQLLYPKKAFLFFATRKKCIINRHNEIREENDLPLNLRKILYAV
jgi:hypothetical protein